jgi:maltose O-acetyltransferase
MKNLNQQTKEFYEKVPPKNIWSYILLLFPKLFYFPLFRGLLTKYGLKNCKNIQFEPGFRFYYGDNVFADHVIFNNTYIMDYAKIEIGQGTAFSKDNKLITASHDYFDRKKIIAKPIKIGKNVWITTNCIILAGVTIGDNSIIGAGSVVSKDIPANCLAAGNPCKIIRKFDENTTIKGFFNNI